MHDFLDIVDFALWGKNRHPLVSAPNKYLFFKVEGPGVWYMWKMSFAWILLNNQGHYRKSQKPNNVSLGRWQGTLWQKLKNCWDGFVNLMARLNG